MNHRFEPTPSILRDIADAAELDGGCVEGVAWGRAHDIDEVADRMDPTHAYWVLVNYGNQMSPEVQEVFVKAVLRDPRISTLTWVGATGLSEAHYRDLASAADRQMVGEPGGLRHRAHALRRGP
jgi:hypothetical protein